jgi:hypothetical protein
MTKYPSLYAALEVSEHDGQRGSSVRCSATLQPLGFVFWTVPGGIVVQWHWRTPDGQHGDASTERNAVQALRDRHKLTLHGPADAPARPTRPTTKRSVPRLGTCTDSPACARRGCHDCERSYGPQHPQPAPRTTTPAPAQRIDWSQSAANVGDLRSAIANALDRAKETK